MAAIENQVNETSNYCDVDTLNVGKLIDLYVDTKIKRLNQSIGRSRSKNGLSEFDPRKSSGNSISTRLMLASSSSASAASKHVRQSESYRINTVTLLSVVDDILETPLPSPDFYAVYGNGKNQ